MERPSFVRNLNLEDTVMRSDSPNQSFGISGASFENSFGFKMELENFQTAVSNLEVSRTCSLNDGQQIISQFTFGLF